MVADAVAETPDAVISAVSSRREESAAQFASDYKIENVFATWQDMIASDKIDAVYVATPTMVREEISVASANAGKHVFAEKPFQNEASLLNIITAARANKVAFLDGTHFVHSPRSAQIKQTMHAEIGAPKLIRTTFYYPFDDKNNIRFDPEKEPLGSVGDLAWYNMRAIVEFLDTDADIEQMTAFSEKDADTGVIIRGSGAVIFKDGKMSSFDFGFNSGVLLTDLDIVCDKGMIRMDDFVLDWNKGFDFSDGHYDLGYTIRADLDEPDNWKIIKIKSEKSQKLHMIESFIKLCNDPSGAQSERSMTASLKTQKLVDALFQACNA
ncbi:MAG: Gfo/Idh/MocA family oxidoreductase [Kordiimonadaceae bacterium]|nr:Gfo/Idh/MocA family oxidoreductase [Kordiimonadaceae bacterium]